MQQVDVKTKKKGLDKHMPTWSNVINTGASKIIYIKKVMVKI